MVTNTPLQIDSQANDFIQVAIFKDKWHFFPSSTLSLTDYSLDLAVDIKL